MSRHEERPHSEARHDIYARGSFGPELMGLGGKGGIDTRSKKEFNKVGGQKTVPLDGQGYLQCWGSIWGEG